MIDSGAISSAWLERLLDTQEVTGSSPASPTVIFLEEMHMTSMQATAEVFWTAFRALPKKEREAFMDRLYSDRSYREDLIDLALIKQRRKEPSRSLKTYLAARRKDR